MSAPEAQGPHQPVLYQEILQAIRPARQKKYADLTVGAGGHSWGILEASQPDGLLLGFDVDPQALSLARGRLAEFGDRAVIVHASYTTLTDQLGELGWPGLDGIVLDLGASSMQFDTPKRGFSFMQGGPLDMRFDSQAPLTAADIVNTWDQDDLADIIYKYGEERQSRRIARAIIAARPLENTKHLAETIAAALKGPAKSRIHPATRTFQALRIAVNGELDNLQALLPQALQALNPGGRFAIISFHSLEDRIVKHTFRQHSRDKTDPTQPKNPVIEPAAFTLVNRKPILPAEDEIQQNPRSRSAKLRVIEKLSI